jgi:hypothetical protein
VTITAGSASPIPTLCTIPLPPLNLGTASTAGPASITRCHYRQDVALGTQKKIRTWTRSIGPASRTCCG